MLFIKRLFCNHEMKLVAWFFHDEEIYVDMKYMCKYCNKFDYRGLEGESAIEWVRSRRPEYLKEVKNEK